MPVPLTTPSWRTPMLRGGSHSVTVITSVSLIGPTLVSHSNVVPTPRVVAPVNRISTASAIQSTWCSTGSTTDQTSDGGRAITFESDRDSTLGQDVFRQPPDGSGAPERIFSAEDNQTPQAWTADGRLLVRQNYPGRGQDLVVLSFDGDSARVSPYLQANWNERGAALSPDGRWVAYSADETGQDEVYVRPFSDAQAGRWQVSENGGQEPVWSPDGRTLYWWEGSDLRAAVVATEPTFAVVSRETVVSEPRRVGEAGFRQYDVHPDGQRFVIVRFVGAGEDPDVTPRFTIVTNWFEELKERMGEAEARPRR